MYAINYAAGGYVIVSNAKTYCPILAIVEHGRYDPTAEFPEGMMQCSKS